MNSRRVIAILIVCALCVPGAAHAAEMDDIYKPLLEKKRILYDGGFDYFEMDEDGRHGGASYDKFTSTPFFYSINNMVKVGLPFLMEVTAGLDEYLPTSYKRITRDPRESINSTQKYGIRSMREYFVELRARRSSAEFFARFMQRLGDFYWNWTIYPQDPPEYFSYISSHYEDLSFGIKYLSDPAPEADPSSLSRVTRPLLAARQFDIEGAWQWRSGAMRRNTPYYTFDRYYNFYQKIKPHFAQSVNMRYGVTDGVELEAGIVYTFPFELEYDYITYFSSRGRGSFLEGSYMIDNNISAPIGLRIRPMRNVEAHASADMRWVNQALDRADKAINSKPTIYTPRSLEYFNIKPKIELTYLYDAGKITPRDDFEKVTETLLLGGQALARFEYELDITHLHKYPGNGQQNLIEPYSLFQYPLDYFVAGSEYSTFFTGNYSAIASDVAPQNYYRLGLNGTLGVTDMINVGLGFGYRSESSLHHYTIYDEANRWFRYKGYYYLDPSANVRLTKNSLVSFNAHYVPQYVTYMESSRYPKEFKSKTQYFNMSLGLKILF